MISATVPALSAEIRQVSGGQFIPPLGQLDTDTARGLATAEAKAHGGVSPPGGLGDRSLAAAERNEQKAKGG